MTPNVASDLETQLTVEAFLAREADLLDRQEYAEWLQLVGHDARYLVPSTDVPSGDPSAELFLINDDRHRIEGRVKRLSSRHAHADYPHPRTRRLVTNVRWRNLEDDERILEVRANFLVASFRVGSVGWFIGEYVHKLRILPSGELEFAVRRANLDLEALGPGAGKVNIII